MVDCLKMGSVLGTTASDDNLGQQPQLVGRATVLREDDEEIENWTYGGEPEKSKS